MLVLFTKVLTASGTHPASQPSGTAGFFLRGYIGCAVKLTSRLYLVPKLKMGSPTTPLPPISLHEEGSASDFTAITVRSCVCATVNVQTPVYKLVQLCHVFLSLKKVKKKYLNSPRKAGKKKDDGHEQGV